MSTECVNYFFIYNSFVYLFIIIILRSAGKQKWKKKHYWYWTANMNVRICEKTSFQIEIVKLIHYGPFCGSRVTHIPDQRQGNKEIIMVIKCPAREPNLALSRTIGCSGRGQPAQSCSAKKGWNKVPARFIRSPVQPKVRRKHNQSHRQVYSIS